MTAENPNTAPLQSTAAKLLRQLAAAKKVERSAQSTDELEANVHSKYQFSVDDELYTENANTKHGQEGKAAQYLSAEAQEIVNSLK